MKGKTIIPLVLGLTIGLFAVKYFVDTIKSARAGGGTTKNVKAVVAAQDIGPYMEITKEMLQEVETPANPLLPAAERVESAEGILGRVTSKAIPKGSPVLVSMLAPEGTAPGIGGSIPPGYRAVSVKIDEVTGVSYQLKPGDWVDVIVVMDIARKGRRDTETVAEVILQHIQVAAVGMSLPTDASKDAGKAKAAKSVTLLVPEADAPKLHLAATRGKITLALRGGDDQVNPDNAVARSGEMFEWAREGEEPPQMDGAASDDATPGFAQFFQTLLASAASQAPAEIAMPQPQPNLPPHEVLVFRGSPAAPGGANVERVTFENAKSNRVINAQRGSSRAQQNTRPVAPGANQAQPDEPADDADDQPLSQRMMEQEG